MLDANCNCSKTLEHLQYLGVRIDQIYVAIFILFAFCKTEYRYYIAAVQKEKKLRICTAVVSQTVLKNTIFKYYMLIKMVTIR